ncbi:MAG: hypothetical protein L6V81_09920 [Clostridium sp.]|nr:MAG: hypothetical protein L6V81_09920 [Clostridium sp.]
MKVIFLLKMLRNKQKKDEIKEVKDGYAKFLITEGLAVPYTNKSASVLKKRNKKKEKIMNKLLLMNAIK